MPTPTYAFQGNHPQKSGSLEKNQEQNVTKLIFKKRQFLLISLRALIKSGIQLWETNKLGLKYKRNNNTRDENWAQFITELY